MLYNVKQPMFERLRCDVEPKDKAGNILSAEDDDKKLKKSHSGRGKMCNAVCSWHFFDLME